MKFQSELELIIAFLGFVLTVVTTIIAVIDIRAAIKNSKSNDLIISNQLLANEYWKAHDNALRLYSKVLRPDGLVVDDPDNPPPMLYKKGWMYEGTSLKKLSDIRLEYISPTEIKRDLKSQRHLKKILPYPGKTFEQNLSLVCNSSLYNGRIYVPVEYTAGDETASLKITEDYFFGFVNTCLPVSYSDAYVLSSASNKPSMLRRKLNPFDFSNRISTIGMVTLTVLHNVEDDENGSGITKYFILHRRSNDVTECKNMINAIPAGSYQPSFFGSEEKIEPLGYTVFREFGEELLGYKEFSEINNVKEIDKLFSADNMDLNDRIIYLGAAINPVNLYLELLTILPMDLSDCRYQHIFGGNKLSQIKTRLTANEESNELYVIELTPNMIQHYSHMHLCTPALKQIMTVFHKHYEQLSKALFPQEERCVLQ